MITSIDLLPGEITLDADLCIIGSGAAGLLLALEFVSSNLDIVILEGGAAHPNDEAQALYEGEVVNESFRGLTAGRAREFGGTTRLWGGQCVKLDPIDFAHRPWVPMSGWPIPHQSLEPYYDRAKSRLEVAPVEFDEDPWRRFRLPPLAFDHDEVRPIHGVFMRRAKLGGRHRATLAAATNIKVLLEANVTAIGTNEQGTEVSEVTFRGLSGRSGRVRARRVVLCAGGIENARLLLLSNLGNTKDQVGRYLQDHPCGRTAHIVTDRPRPLQDHFNMLYGRGAFLLPKLALSEASQRAERTLNCVGRLSYEYESGSGMKALRDLVVDVFQRRWPDDLNAKLLSVARAAPRMVPDAWRVARHGLSPAPRPSRIWLETFSEQTPNPASRVTLSDQRDVLGLRRVRIDWRLDELTGHTLRVFTAKVGTEFARLGLGSLETAAWLDEPVPQYPDVMDSYHPAGTTRMSDRPSNGVVDTNCQVFGVQGLYVAGSSVFPTSGAANPTLTIAALALRLADHLKTAKRQPDNVAYVREPSIA